MIPRSYTASDRSDREIARSGAFCDQQSERQVMRSTTAVHERIEVQCG